jgi:surface-anchored protein
MICKIYPNSVATYLRFNIDRGAMKPLFAIAATISLGSSLPLSAASLLTGGHIDGPAFGYDSMDGFEPHYHNEGGADGAIINGVRATSETEYEPDELITVVQTTSTTTVGPTTYYWLPETEQGAANNGVPFLGFGLEELNPLDWTGGTVTLTLLSINGPGEFRLWQNDGFGGVIDFINTDGGAVGFNLSAGSHTHFNWGFTDVGLYDLAWEISGTHVTDNYQSGSGTYLYSVPEPSSAVITLSGSLAAFRRQRRRM